MRICVFAAVMVAVGGLHAGEYHVAKAGNDSGNGSAGKPFQTIQGAADVAQPGDTVTVHEGVYRERINPLRGGTSDDQRIVYRAATGASVTIKGSEHITGWKQVEGETWMVKLPNTFFGDYNPYGDRLEGAWYEARQAYHTGAVYMNGHWLKEAAAKPDVVKSLASGSDGGGAAELMNIGKFILGGRTHLQATEWIEKSEGIKASTDDPGKVYAGRMTDGSYVAYKIDFGEESRNMSLTAASPVSGGIIELRKDSLRGELIGRFDIGFTAEWTHFQTFHANITPVSGVQKIYCVFKARRAPAVDPSRDIGSWFAEVDEQNTTIWADFKGKDPNQELVEINARKAVFYPEKEGVDYITVSGFTMEQSANPWTAPTAEQIGLIGTHWSKGWIIEDNTIRYSVCVGVTLGKHGDEHDHTYDYNNTTIPIAVKRGWSKQNIGSHIVRNNHIYNCGQGGIQGSLGCSFSTITGNKIHDIRKDHNYGGCETAGIKLHGAVDVLIERNHVYNCEHWGGIWLDWMAQGARVTRNLLHGNSQDLMFEVNHGPHLVDNNLLLSRAYVTDASGGGAFVHNLWYGKVNIWPDLKARKTPYFKPHSVDVIDRIDVDQNDDRYYNNLFVGPKGTSAYDEPDFAIAASGNVFLAGAKPSKHEVNPRIDADDPAVKLEKRDDGWWLEMNVPLQVEKRPFVTSELLGKASIPDAPFENRDGTPCRIDTDYFGSKRDIDNPAPGPFRTSEGNKVRLKVWPVVDSALRQETLPLLKDGIAPQTVEEMWEGFDPRAEPLDVEVLHEWEQDGIVLKVLRYRIGVFKGQKAMMAAVYGFPKGGKKLPGLVQIHGGGQYAHYNACLTNAKRGYATLSISWGGRIDAPGYRVSPNEVKLFWENKTDDPAYKLITDWGALDAYHHPSRNGKDAFASIPVAEWTLDPVESPRNNSWFLCTLGARRALTFLEQQPEVNGDRLGVYGHSMGGKLTVLTAGSDDRVKAAAPSCGGISDRDNKSALFRNTVGDDPNLKNISCPTIFLSPANDFHGRINDLPASVGEIKTDEWRVTCAAHHNHQDTADYEVATQLWMDEHLKGTFAWPKTPQTKLILKTASGIPSFSVKPDESKPVLAVDVFYTQQGQINGLKDDRENTIARFWHHVRAVKTGGGWAADLPLFSTDKPLWVYANVVYPLDEAVTGAGYYYRTYTTKQFNLSSLVQMVMPEALQADGAKATLKPSRIIERFDNGWEKEWFSYRPAESWARSTHKVYHPQWAAPTRARLSLEVRSRETNKLVVGIDMHVAEVQLDGGSKWQKIVLPQSAFKDAAGTALSDWNGIVELRLGDKETLRDKKKNAKQEFGARWQGDQPSFRNLTWVR